MELTASPEYPVDYKGPVQGLYLHVTIDNLSRWPEVQITKSTDFKTLEGKLESLFSLHGVPEVVNHTLLLT